MIDALVLLVCIGAGTVGGVFFAFSTFVMKALAELPASQGSAAMQSINVVVLNPLFLGLFMGTALLSLACVIASLLSWTSPRSPLLLVSGLLYLLGSFGVTVRPPQQATRPPQRGVAGGRHVLAHVCPRVDTLEPCSNRCFDNVGSIRCRRPGGIVDLRPASSADLALLRRWDEQPHVVAADPNDDRGLARCFENPGRHC